MVAAAGRHVALIGVLSLMCAGGASAHAGDGAAIRGVITSKADGKPVKDVRIIVFNPAKHMLFSQMGDDLTLSDFDMRVGGVDEKTGEVGTKLATSGQVTTGDDGRYEVAGLDPSCKYQLVVYHATLGYTYRIGIAVAAETPTMMDIEMVGPAFIEVEVERDLIPPGIRAQISVSLMSASMMMVNGEMQFGDNGTPHMNFTKTAPIAERGPTRVGPVPPARRLQVSVIAGGMGAMGSQTPIRSTGVSVIAGETASVGIRVGDGATICGRVTDPDGKPCARLIVSAAVSGGFIEADQQATFSGITDADGRYELRGVSPGAYQLAVIPGQGGGFGGFWNLATLGVRVRDKTSRIVRDFQNIDAKIAEPELPAGVNAYAIPVRVTSKATGERLAGVQIAAAPMKGANVSVYADPSGAISLYVNDAERDALLAKSGNAMIGGGPWGGMSYTDSDGSGAIGLLLHEDGEYIVIAVHPEAGIAVIPNVSPGKHKNEPLNIELERAVYLSVPAVKVDFGADAQMYHMAQWIPPGVDLSSGETIRKGLEGATNVSLSSVWREGFAGVSRIGPLPARAAILVSSSVNMPKRTTTVTTLRQAVVRAEPGATLEYSPVVGEGATISGRVVAEGGKPMADVTVVVKTDDPGRLVLSAITDKDGKYRLTGVPAGNFPIEITRNALRTAPG